MGRSFYTERRNSDCSLPCGNGDPSGHEAVRNGDGKTPRSKKKKANKRGVSSSAHGRRLSPREAKFSSLLTLQSRSSAQRNELAAQRDAPPVLPGRMERGVGPNGRGERNGGRGGWDGRTVDPGPGLPRSRKTTRDRFLGKWFM